MDIIMPFMSPKKKEYICSCYYKRNMFLSKFLMHVYYDNPRQFEKEYKEILRLKGCATEKQWKQVLEELESEVERRKKYHEKFLENYERNKLSYPKLHPKIWKLDRSFLDPRFLKIVKDAQTMSPTTLLWSLLDNGGDITEAEVYSFPVFLPEFCNLLVEEMKNFIQYPGPKSRPNTMNFSGVSLDEMGFSDGVIIQLVRDYLSHITKLLFPNWGGGSLDSFKSFIVHYDEHGDKELSTHYDNAEVSINISLNSDFEGGNLQFYEYREDEEKPKPTMISTHKIGHGTLHSGDHIHSAAPLTSGFRDNMIIWMRSSAKRKMRCPMCGYPPTLMEVPIAGEGYLVPDMHTSMCCCS